MGGTIRLKEALKVMHERDENHQPKPFNVSFVSYDKKRRTGGSIINLNNHVASHLSHDTHKNGTIGITNPKNSHHPITVHTWLLIRLNGDRILL